MFVGDSGVSSGELGFVVSGEVSDVGEVSEAGESSPGSQASSVVEDLGDFRDFLEPVVVDLLVELVGFLVVDLAAEGRFFPLRSFIVESVPECAYKCTQLTSKPLFHLYFVLLSKLNNRSIATTNSYKSLG